MNHAKTRLLAGAAVFFMTLPLAPLAHAQSPAEMALRLNRLEEQVRQLTGRNEELQFQMRQMQDGLQKQMGDVDFRLKDLEGGKGGGSRPAAQPPQRRSEAAPPLATGSAAAGRPDDGSLRAPGNSSADTTRGAPGPQNLGGLPSGPTAGPVTGQPGPLVRPEAGAPMVIAPEFGGGTQAGGPPPASAQAAARGGSMTASGSAEEEYALGQGFLQRKDYEFAETQFSNFVSQFPKDPRTPDALYGLGESYYQRQRHSDAIEPFLKVVSDYPQSPRASDSMLRLGQTLGAINEKEQACATLLELSRKYPRSAAKQQGDREQQRLKC
jgi:tol-pal system protein YbgF